MSDTLYIADFYDCKDLNPNRAKDYFLVALKTANFNILDDATHIYTDNRVTVTVILDGAHAAFHTWPEKNLATVDIFCCDPKLKPRLSIVDLGGRLGSRKIDTNKSSRGALLKEPKWEK